MRRKTITASADNIFDFKISFPIRKTTNAIRIVYIMGIVLRKRSAESKFGENKIVRAYINGIAGDVVVLSAFCWK
jgi:hypothetical protein